MIDNAEFVTVLVVAVGLTFVVGRLLVTVGDPFLQEVFIEPKVTHSVNMLLSVLFHLITLGVLSIISVIDIDLGTALQSIVVKIGIVLLVLGISYGISMLVLIRIRARRHADRLSEQVSAKLARQGDAGGPAVQSMSEPGGPNLGDPAPTHGRSAPSTN